MNEDKSIKTYSLIGAVCSIICSIYFFMRPFSYGATIIGIYNIVPYVLPYIMIAVLLLLRKKNVIWLIPSGICLYQTFRQWHWFLFDDTLDCAVAICLILAQIILFIILLCNTIPALEKKAMAINEVLWFVPALLMFIGCVINIFNYYTIRNYFIGNIMNLLQVIIALCIGIWINSIYPKPEVKKGSDNYSSSIAPDEFYCGMAKHVLLLLFTFGIWYLIWIYRMTNYTNAVENEEYRDPTKKLLLCMFIPFYSIYWTYKTAQRIDKMAITNRISSDMTTLCLILAIFVPIIPPILMQDKMNNIVRANNTQPVSKQENVNKETFGTAEQLKEFKELLDSGVITQEEFDAKKKQLLGL